jgi:hypothetical protein
MTGAMRKMAACVAFLALSTNSVHGATLEALDTFGSAFPGWRAPFEVLPGDAAGTDSISPGLYNYLGDAFNNTSVNLGNLERGLAYNPTTGHLILVSRNNAGNTLPSIRLLDGQTGVDIGALDLGTGVISGGTFLYNMVGVADDGAIYVGNLTTNTAGAGGPFRLYRWADETSTPTLAFNGDPLNGTRLGDSLDVIGGGADTRLVAGYDRRVAGGGTLSNSFAVFTTTDGLNFTATDIELSATSPATLPPNGDFGIAVTFTDSDTVIGKGLENEARVVEVSGSMGNVTTNFSTDGITLRQMDFAVVGGKPLVAMVEASPDQTEAARARLFVYDMTDPSLPLEDRKIAEASNLPFTPGGPNQFANLNATGQVKFGAIEGNTAVIYAMSTNNGVQAFELTLEPAGPDGDYNGDGKVNAADYVVWRKNPGSFGGDPEGYEAWRANFGSMAGGGGLAGANAAVPEPAGLLLLVLATSGVALFCRR